MQMAGIVLLSLGIMFIWAAIQNINPLATAKQFFGPGPNAPVYFGEDKNNEPKG